MTSVLVLVGGLATVALFVALLSALAPTRVTYTESIDVDAPISHVYDDIRLQDRLMRWSVWPRETRSQCAVDPGRSGADGTEGARTVFLSKGKPVGHQEITRLVDQREVAMRLEGPGPPHEPSMRFELEPLGPEVTRVHLHFDNRLPRPFNAIWHFAGLSARTRRLHVKDLEGLKAFTEPPHRDVDGRVVGRPPTLDNPYERPLPASA